MVLQHHERHNGMGIRDGYEVKTSIFTAESVRSPMFLMPWFPKDLTRSNSSLLKH